METITVRDFRLNANKYLDNIGDGLLLAVYGEVKYKILPVKSVNTLPDTDPKSVNTIDKPKKVNKLPPAVASERIQKCNWIGCTKEVVGYDKVNGRGFCKDHL